MADSSPYTEISVARIDVLPVKKPEEFVRNFMRYFCTRKARGNFEEGGNVLVCRVETSLSEYEKRYAPRVLQFALDMHSVLSRYGGKEGRSFLERVEIENRYLTDDVTWEMTVRF